MQVNATAEKNVLIEIDTYFAVFAAISNVGGRITAIITMRNIVFLV